MTRPLDARLISFHSPFGWLPVIYVSVLEFHLSVKNRPHYNADIAVLGERFTSSLSFFLSLSFSLSPSLFLVHSLAFAQLAQEDN